MTMTTRNQEGLEAAAATRPSVTAESLSYHLADRFKICPTTEVGPPSE
jgi:hypothetical protein